MGRGTFRAGYSRYAGAGCTEASGWIWAEAPRSCSTSGCDTPSGGLEASHCAAWRGEEPQQHTESLGQILEHLCVVDPDISSENYNTMCKNLTLTLRMRPREARSAESTGWRSVTL